MSKPVVIDLCCGLGGWSSGFLAEGWDAIGFDIEKHEYGGKRYPGELILADVLTLNGYDLRAANPALVVASPPCTEYSHMAMPFSRGRRKAKWREWERTSPFSPRLRSERLVQRLFPNRARVERPNRSGERQGRAAMGRQGTSQFRELLPVGRYRQRRRADRSALGAQVWNAKREGGGGTEAAA